MEKYCQKTKLGNQIEFINNSSNPIDLYHFMFFGKLSKKSSILQTMQVQIIMLEDKHGITKNNRNSLVNKCSYGFVASIIYWSSHRKTKNQIISVTGDGSIELNIQELKTIYIII